MEGSSYRDSTCTCTIAYPENHRTPKAIPCTASHTPYANEANKECPGPPRIFHACLLYKMWTLHLREKKNGNAKQGFPQINIFETFKLFRYPLLQTSLGQFTTAMRFFPQNDILYRQVK